MPQSAAHGLARQAGLDCAFILAYMADIELACRTLFPRFFAPPTIFLFQIRSKPPAAGSRKL
jgi:hypothetical protein